MEIQSIRHKALRSFAETGKTKGLPGNLNDRLSNMLAYLAEINATHELLLPPSFGAHLLTGDLTGRWTLMDDGGAVLMAFEVYEQNAIADLDLEDYH